MNSIDKNKLDRLLENCLSTDHDGVTSIHHAYYEFDIYDISQYSVEEINELFLKQKSHIDKIKKINKDLLGHISTNGEGITSIYHYEFELSDISKVSSEEINELYSKQRLLLDRYIENGQYRDYIMAIPKSARINAFLRFTEKPEIKRQKLWNISDKEYWEFLKFLWTEYSENVFKNRDTWWFLFRANRKNREFFMNEAERIFLDKLPNKFTIYRGYSKPKPTDKLKPENLKWWNLKDTFSRMGFSYTLSKEVGVTYFKKYEVYNRENPPDTNYYKYENELFEGEVSKERVLFYNDTKQEKEIIIVDEFSEYGNPY